MHLHGTYNLLLVALSLFISVLSAYTALDILYRLKSFHGRTKVAWMAGAAGVLSLGIWSMHFVGMMSFHLDVLSLRYDMRYLFASMVPPVLAVFAAVHTVTRTVTGRMDLAAGSLLMGGGIGTMHYSGMLALRAPASIWYDPLLVAFSVAIAIGASYMVLRSTIVYGSGREKVVRTKWASAVLFGIGVAATHYTGMTAASFTSIPGASEDTGGWPIDNAALAGLVGLVTLIALTFVLLGSYADRRLALRTARNNERRFNSIFEQNPDMVCLFDLKGRLIRANPAAERIMGYPVSRLAGSPFTYFLNRRDTRKVVSAFRRVADGEPQTVEFTVRSKAGRSVILSTTMVPLATDGRISEIYTLSKDVTDRKKAERELVLAKDAAEAAVRAKSEFLAMMSHEIRTPLNGVLTVATLLMDTKLDSEQQEYVKIIEKSGSALLTVINEILDFSKAESGKMELRPEAFDLRQCLEDSMALFTALCRERRLEISIAVDPTVPRTVVGDVTRLRQVLINLVGNAVKFTDEGGIYIQVFRKGQTEKSMELEFVVRDTGIGIPAEKLGLLFQPFTQLDSSTSRRYGGTGLGLAICKKLVGLMGGSIRVEPARDRGAVFVFTVSVGLAQAQADRAGPPTGMGREERILS